MLLKIARDNLTTWRYIELFPMALFGVDVIYSHAHMHIFIKAESHH